jgi:PIN domain nuclease of toxin-antitoxin system
MSGRDEKGERGEGQGGARPRSGRYKPLLLDTHTFLWWRGAPEKLERVARERIAHAELVFVSAASAWEAAIKIGLGRLSLPEPFEAGVAASGFEPLPITFEHATRAAELPPHHRDPFDRMLIAQAQVERLILVTRDRQLERYSLPILWS